MTFVSSFFLFFLHPYQHWPSKYLGSSKHLLHWFNFTEVTSRDLSCDKKNPKETLENIKKSLSFYKQVLNFILYSYSEFLKH